MFASLGTRVNTVGLARKQLLCELNGGHSHSGPAVRGGCGHGMSTSVAMPYMQVTTVQHQQIVGRAVSVMVMAKYVGGIRSFRKGEWSGVADRRGSARRLLVYGE